MTRVSTAEMYDDKDVITQICKLKDGLNSALGGIIADIDIVNDELVIDWADGESISLPLPSPTGISSIAGSISGTNLTITIYMTDGSSHAFTTPLNGIATEGYVDTKDAQNVKLTGDQTIAGVKTFSGSANVPNVPADLLGASAVNEAYVNDATEGTNNIRHKSGYEIVNGFKKFNDTVQRGTSIIYNDKPNPPAYVDYMSMIGTKLNNDNEPVLGIVSSFYTRWNNDGSVQLIASCINSDGKTYTQTTIATLRNAW